MFPLDENYSKCEDEQMAGNSTSAPGTSVTSRALALLAAFDPQHRQLTLSQLAQRANLPISTAHRLVGELTAWGALRRLDSGSYVVGQRLWDLGLLAPIQAGLRELASPFLSDLFATVHQTVHLGIRDHTRVLYLERLAGADTVPILSTMGSRLPLHATGVGKVLLAWAPPPVQATVMAQLTRITAYTITAPGLLQQQLQRVRDQGFATTAEEMSLGAASIAVPVFHHDHPVAALGLVSSSLPRARQLLAPLQVAARGIERALHRATVLT